MVGCRCHRLSREALSREGTGTSMRADSGQRRPLLVDGVSECAGEAHRQNPCIGFQLGFAFRHRCRTANGKLDGQRSTTRVLLAPADPRKDMIGVKRLKGDVYSLAHSDLP